MISARYGSKGEVVANTLESWILRYWPTFSAAPRIRVSLGRVKFASVIMSEEGESVVESADVVERRRSSDSEP